ncbi:MAG TPA: cellulase family glycosylhydrolase [Longimicrobium sp.]|jgi:hypothetical protein
MHKLTVGTIRPARSLSMAALAGMLALAACDVTDDPLLPDDIACDAAANTVSFGGRTIVTAPNGYAAVGNQIVDVASCQPFRFVGVARPALSFSADGGRLGVDTAAAADFARIRAWNANTVRIELAQYYWVRTARSFDPGYQARVDRVVKQARAAGLKVIIALQASDRGDPNSPIYNNMHQPMADVNHSVPFWRDVAGRYKDDGGILFELYSEPYPINPGGTGFSNWDLWLNGGLAESDFTYDERRPAFQAAGMQQLYETVRATGANNMVIVSGTQWGYNLREVPNYRVKGYNIAYSTHPWDSDGGRQPDVWERDWAFLAKTDPVMITEFGDYDCTDTYVKAVLDKADELKISWIAWAWIAPGSGQAAAGQEGPGSPICDLSLLIEDWSGTPTRTGALVKSRLGSY